MKNLSNEAVLLLKKLGNSDEQINHLDNQEAVAKLFNTFAISKLNNVELIEK